MPQTQSLDEAKSVTPFQGPITRSRAKKIQQEVNSLLAETYFNIDDNYILPKSCTLLLLRFTHVQDLLGVDNDGLREYDGGLREDDDGLCEDDDRLRRVDFGAHSLLTFGPTSKRWATQPVNFLHA